MRRMFLMLAVVATALVFTVVAFVQEKQATKQAEARSRPGGKVTMKVTDRNGRPIKLESLTAEQQAAVHRAERVVEFWKSIEPPTAQPDDFWIHVECCPLWIDAGKGDLPKKYQ